MIRAIFLASVFLYVGLKQVAAQAITVVSGQVSGPSGEPVSQCTIQLRDSANQTLLAFAITRPDGFFRLQAPLIPGQYYILQATHIQFETQWRMVPADSLLTKTGATFFSLTPRTKLLQEVVIRAEPPPFRIRGDTIDFKASAYRGPEVRKVEDLLRNIQGFDVAPDGKIRFQGKEVDRVLIEGEDLTEQQYQLLTRNLHAGLIDRIQVLQHFDANRINATVNASQKVGINLTIDQQYAHKWSGNAEAGVGNDARRMAELNLIRLTKRFKFVQFFQHNTIGRAANADMNFHYRDGEPASTGQRDEAGGLISSGSIEPPSLPDTYTKNNNDYSGFAIGSWKASPALRLKVLAAAADLRLAYRSYSSQTVQPPDGDTWTTRYEDTLDKRTQSGLIRTSLMHDGGRKNLGRYDLDLVYTKALHHYRNQAAGAISDSLREKLETGIRGFRLQGAETFQLPGQRVLNLKTLIQVDQPQQEFTAATYRYASYYGLPKQNGLYQQQLDERVTEAELDATVARRQPKHTWTWGLRGWFMASRYDARTSLDSAALSPTGVLSAGGSTFQVIRFSGYGQGEWKLGKGMSWTWGGVLGAGLQQYASGGQTIARSALVYKGYLGFQRSFSALQHVSLQVQSSRDVPGQEHYHPSGLLSGQATIKDGAREVLFPSAHAIQASYLVNNLHKGRLLLMGLHAGIGNRQWVSGIVTNPSYAQFYPEAADGNRNLAAQVMAEQFVRIIRSKLSIQVTGMYHDLRMNFNGVSTENRSSQFSAEPKFSSAFKGKVNAEGSFRLTYTLNRSIPEAGLASDFTQWQYQGSAKLKLRMSSRIYGALQWMAYRLAPGSVFMGGDLYLKWNPAPAWSVALYGHNLLQQGRIEQKLLAPNSISIQGFDLVSRYGLLRVAVQF